MTHPNAPLEVVAKDAAKKIALGYDVYQKFTCCKCGERQTIDVPNVFYTSGKCEECEAVTDIKLHGCNYLAVMNFRR